MKIFTIIEKLTNNQVKLAAEYFELKAGRVFFKKREAADGKVVAVFNFDDVFGFYAEAEE